MKEVLDPVVTVLRDFTIRLRNDSSYPGAPPVQLYLGASEKVLRFKAGEQRLGIYHDPVVWDASQFQPGELAKLEPLLDQPLAEEFKNFDSLSPTDRRALLEARAGRYNNLGIFLGWITKPIASHSWVVNEKYLGPAKTAEQLRIEAAADQANAAAKLAEAETREAAERESPGLKDWDTLGETDGLKNFDADVHASGVNVRTRDNPTVAPNAQTRAS